MKSIFRYIRSYIWGINWLVFLPSFFLISFLVYLNYGQYLHGRIRSYGEEQQFVTWYFIFLGVFAFPYLLHHFFEKKKWFYNWQFVVLLVLAPAIFAWKMVYNIGGNWSDDMYKNAYWNAVLYWPLKLLVVTTVLLLLWYWFDRKEQPFYGLRSRYFHAKPYWLMLLLMVPLIAAASTQPDFLATYPKIKNIAYMPLITRCTNFFSNFRTAPIFLPSNFFFADSWCWPLPSGRAKMPSYRWPFFTAPFILASRWGSAFLLFLAACYWALLRFIPVAFGEA